jgi:glutathione S-transferase
MKIKLYVVHGSHPCAAVMKAFDLKRLVYSVIEWPPPMHAPIQQSLFGSRTVPAIKLDTGERITGSRAIMRWAERVRPEPALIPSDPKLRVKVEEAERWGDQVFQQIARNLIWPAMKNSPGSIVGYSATSKLPFPGPVLRLSAPVITRGACRLNRTNDEVARLDLQALPGHLDRIDAWIAEGTIGDPDHPNVADLQILSTVRLMHTLGDARPLIDGRPCGPAALRLFPEMDGDMPAGSIIAA